MVAGADSKLFRVNPVEIAVQNQIGSSERELPGFASGRGHDPNIVLVHERNRTSVRRKLGIKDVVLRSRKVFHFLRVQIVDQKSAPSS